MPTSRRHRTALAFWLALWWLLLATLTPLASVAATVAGPGALPICTVAGLHLAEADPAADHADLSAQQRAGQHCLLCLAVDLPPLPATSSGLLPASSAQPFPQQRLSVPPADASRRWALRRKQAPPHLPG